MFKVGDEVVCVKSEDHPHMIGKEFIVINTYNCKCGHFLIEINQLNGIVRVCFCIRSLPNTGEWWESKCFRKIERHTCKNMNVHVEEHPNRIENPIPETV